MGYEMEGNTNTDKVISVRKETQEKGIRINKYLSDVGICSRRQADQFILDGKVMIDSHRAQMGERVFSEQKIICCGKEVIKSEESKVLLAFNKPKGIVCTTSSREKNNIIDYIGYEKRIFPIGRLDKDSEGLILLTNEGMLSDQILRGSHYHEKEYVVTLNKDITDVDLQKMREGIPILDTVTRPCEVYRLKSNVFRMILTQGLNRQIRRMCEYLGYRVVYLKRIRIMNIMLDNIPKGKYREVTKEELQELKNMLTVNGKQEKKQAKNRQSKDRKQNKETIKNEKKQKKGRIWIIEK